MFQLAVVDVFRHFGLRGFPDVQPHPGFKLFDFSVHGSPPEIIKSVNMHYGIVSI